MPQQIPEAPGISRIVQPAVLIIDVQPHFVDVAGEVAGRLLPRLVGLLDMAGCLRLPLVATFERPQKNGWLPDELERAWPAHGLRFEKQTYDCCGEPRIAAALAGMGRRQFLVAGAETDVCVLQSVLSLLERGYEVFLLEDCLFSSEPHTAPAVARMRAAGAVPCTLKTAYYELMPSWPIRPPPGPAGRLFWSACRNRRRSPSGSRRPDRGHAGLTLCSLSSSTCCAPTACRSPSRSGSRSCRRWLAAWWPPA
jgi:nicotinamidase-related amidase